jgi:hypothetical protein
VIDEVFDQLARGLLGSPEVLGHIGSGGITFTDPHKGEPMCGADVIKATSSETLLNAVDKLAGQAQHCDGCLPAVHVDHLDMV